MLWLSFILGFLGSLTSFVVIFALEVLKAFDTSYPGPTTFTAIIWFIAAISCVFCSFLVFTKWEAISIIIFLSGLVLVSLSIIEHLHGMSIHGFKITLFSSILIVVSGIFDHLDNSSRKI